MLPIRILFLAGALFAFLCLVEAGYPARIRAASPPNPVLGALREQAKARGLVRVIVKLALAFKPEGDLRPFAAKAQRDQIRQTQDALVAQLAGQNATVVRAYKYIPALALTVDANALDVLASSSLVAWVNRDEAREPSLFASLPLIGAHIAWSAGAGGQGQSIAVLDTGVDKTHPFLAGKVVAEGCFSSILAGLFETFCPNGRTSSTRPGSGMPCDLTIEVCDHGTHVAGIAAGKPEVLQVPFGFGKQKISGVAPESSLIAIQVFSRVILPSVCGSQPVPCTRTFDNDQLAALEHVYELRQNYRIAAVNMSLGGGKFTEPCDASFPYYKEIIDTLRSVGIPTIIASGNDGFPDALSSPACISTAISVGSSDTIVAQQLGVYNGVEDWVSEFSNRNLQLNLLAPGNFILSSVPEDSFKFKSGTSMAAPTVAGAWAALKSQVPNATIDEVLAALRITARPVKDWRVADGMTMPRLNVDKALWELRGCSTAPAAPIPANPNDGARKTRTRVTLRWLATACAARYRYIVRSGTPDGPIVDRHKVLGATQTRTAELQPGATYYWKIFACNRHGCSSSDWRSFTIAPPTAAP